MTGDHGHGVVTPILRPRSLTAIVVDQIRDLIITGKLGLGEQLSENTLAEQLGVSRTPVREAFLRLETERLVEVRPQRGTFVFHFDADELREISELRQVLETGALRIALSRDRDGVIAALAAAVEAAEPVLADGPEAYQVHDTAFHETLIRATENRELIDAYARISGRIRTIRYRLTRTRDQIAGSQRDHRSCLELMQAGRDDEAVAQLGLHVYRGYRTFLETLDPAAGRLPGTAR